MDWSPDGKFVAQGDIDGQSKIFSVNHSDFKNKEQNKLQATSNFPNQVGILEHVTCLKKCKSSEIQPQNYETRENTLNSIKTCIFEHVIFCLSRFRTRMLKF